MARLPRITLPGIPQHIIQRWNNRQACFASEEDFTAYAHWLAEYAEKYKIAIHAWVFMTKHVRLLVSSKTEDGISRLMQTLGRCYVRYFNYSYKRTGALWEGRFKSCVVDAENYLLICQRYIELNPVRAGMVSQPCDYIWSNYQANGLGKSIKMWQPHRIYCELGKTPEQRASAYREMFRGHFEETILKTIRDATNQGMALGNDRFKEEIESLTERRVMLLKRGPKPKNKAEFLL